MYKLNPPKFKFAIYVIEHSKFKPNTTQSGQTLCYADSYEISADGAITFFQIGTSLIDNKKIKIPVLSYPRGKWETCILVDDNNQLPVFTPNSQGVMIKSNYSNAPTQQNIPVISPTTEETEKPMTIQKENNNEMDDLENLFGNQIQNNQNNFENDTNYNNWHSNKGQNPININNAIPGVNQHNPDEYKKKKNDFLEKRIKEYIKYEDRFDIDAFLSSVQQEAKIKDIGKISEIDVTWTASTLIRNKSVLARKFSEPLMQKTLAIILPDIMRRQWNGKMGPILQVLQDREETKNADAIDLAVWMAQNGFTE